MGQAPAGPTPANQSRADSASPSASIGGAINGALDDFYQQTIRRAGRDIAGYVSDAINDPAGFSHAIGPSLAGLGPFVGQLPGIVRGAVGAVGLARRRPEHEPGDLTPDQPEDTGEKSAATPIGRRGEPIKVTPGTNRPTEIGGRVYTGHAADQMQGRGIPPSAVEDAIQNGAIRPGNGPDETVHIGANGVIVVTGSRGQVITVITGGR